MVRVKKRAILMCIVILLLCGAAFFLFKTLQSKDAANGKEMDSILPEEESEEEPSQDTTMDMGTEQPSENLDNEVEVSEDWE